ncbi:transcription factor AP-2, partial [Cooperia oncophora]
NRGPKPVTSNAGEVFDETTGRLCLLNSSTKYKVTLGEIQRRLSHPETLHASLVNSILRKAKLKDGCRVLRDRLAEKGVTLPRGRRKTATTTTFTALCETEAVLMARDFDCLCRNSLNTCAIARRSNQMTYSLPELDGASRVLAGILGAFEDVPEKPEDYVERDASSYTINILSLLTHGFGHNAVKTVIRLLMEIIEQQRHMIHAGPLAYNPFSEPKPLFM